MVLSCPQRIRGELASRTLIWINHPANKRDAYGAQVNRWNRRWWDMLTSVRWASGALAAPASRSCCSPPGDAWGSRALIMYVPRNGATKCARLSAVGTHDARLA